MRSCPRPHISGRACPLSRTKGRISLGGGTPAIRVASGEGVRVRDAAGRSYIDCTSQGWALYLGHSHPEIQARIREVTTRLWHTHQGFDTDERDRFVDMLLERAGPSYDRVALAPTGALAVEAAMKLALVNRDNPERRTVARVDGGFHGSTLGVLGASWPAADRRDDRSLGLYAERSGPFATLSVPHCFDCPFNRNRGLPSEQRECALECCGRLEAEIESMRPSLLAVLIEPIQGSGGQIPLPIEWLRTLRDVAERERVFVIYDEIQTYCRAGRYFTHLDDLKPHLVALGKGLAGGFACGAVLMRSDVEGFPPGIHNLHTFSSSALAHDIAVKVVEIIDRDALLENAVNRGREIVERLASYGWPDGLVDVRQEGLHIGLEFASPENPLQADPSIAGAIRNHALEAGVILGLSGYRPHVLKIKPPLTVQSAECETIVDVVVAAAQSARKRR